MSDQRPPDSTQGAEPPASQPPASPADAPTETQAAPMAPPPPAPAAQAPAAPPPAAWAAPAAAAVPPKGNRTTLALVAGILLLIGGIGGLLIGLLVAVIGGSFVASLGDFYSIPDLEGVNAGTFVGGIVAFVGVVIAAYSVAYLLAGIGVIRNSNWARVLGIVVGVISGLIWLSGVGGANAVSNAQGVATGGAFALVMLAVHAYIVVALLFFWRTRPSST